MSPPIPLAPDATVDDVLPALVEVATTVASQHPELPTILMGDSAGGALILTMATRLRDDGGPRPVSLIALSPWLDATLDEDAVADRADRHGVDVHVHEVSAMFHVWMNRRLPEGRRTRTELRQLVRSRAADRS